LEALKQSLSEKLGLLRQVLEVTRLQPELIRQEDTDGLLRNIEDRQRLLDRLNAIQAELPSKETMRQDEECRALARETTKLLHEIQAQDARNEQAATERMALMREQLRKLGEGQKTVKGYDASPAGPNAVYFDKLK
jgi:hypothetical protein